MVEKTLIPGANGAHLREVTLIQNPASVEADRSQPHYQTYFVTFVILPGDILSYWQPQEHLMFVVTLII
jgi:hypothetical protein